MKPQKQLIRHAPADGFFGDCHRTAIACVLDMDAADVPHFMDGTPGSGPAEDSHDKVEAWLNARGLCTISVLFKGDFDLDDVLRSVNFCNLRSRPVFILGGRSATGCNHSVVCCDGKIVCDPGQNDPGIVGPCDDGFYWLTFFGSLVAAHPLRTTEAAA